MASFLLLRAVCSVCGACVQPEADGAHVVTFTGLDGVTSASSQNSLPRRDPPSFSAYQQSVRGIVFVPLHGDTGETWWYVLMLLAGIHCCTGLLYQHTGLQSTTDRTYRLTSAIDNTKLLIFGKRS